MVPSTPTPKIDSRLLRISANDNIGVAISTLEAGERVTIRGQSIVLAERVPIGHKLALACIAPGEKIVKYGLPIGSATAHIGPGDYVHTHNIESDYLPTYTFNGGNSFLSE